MTLLKWLQDSRIRKASPISSTARHQVLSKVQEHSKFNNLVRLSELPFFVGPVDTPIIGDDANGWPTKDVSQLTNCPLIDTPNVLFLPTFILVFIIVLKPFEDHGARVSAICSLLSALCICVHGIPVPRIFIFSRDALSTYRTHYYESCAIYDAL